jgi:hypothetical protein
MGASSSKAAAAAAGAPEADAKPGGASPVAYLLLSSESGGCLTLQWSATPVRGAMASFKPQRAVAAHKLTQNAGRVELARNLGVTKTKLLEGVAAFVKEAVANDGVLTLHDASHVELWAISGTKVQPVARGKGCATAGLSAVACMPAQNTSFDGVKTLDIAQFVGTAIREGAAWKR